MKNIVRISAIALMAGMLASMPASAVTVNLGGSGTSTTLNVNGNGGTPGAPLVQTDAPDGRNAVVDTGGNATLANLFGGGNDPTAADIDVGSPGTADGHVLLNLFGPGDDANVALGSTPGGSNNDVAIDLFGNSTGGNPGTNGGTGANGGNGGNGGNSVGMAGASGAGSANGVRMALGGPKSGKCFTPNAAQMAKLTSRHTYGEATFSSWAGVTQLKIVNVGVCNGANIAADANIAALQAGLDSNAVIRAKLTKAGHSVGDVIAVDKTGKTLVVYVM